MKNNRLINAAQTLFCNENSLEVQVAVFAGIDKITFLDINQYKGNIFYLLEKSKEYIKEKMNWRAKTVGLERQEIPEVPVEAVREVLVNSLCHRDYLASESNKIAIFKNRIEIWNPGDFPEGLTPQDYIKNEEQSVLRNPIIADILYKSRGVEKWGSGLKKIYNLCKEAGVKVDFKVLKTGFMVVFHRAVAKEIKPSSGEGAQKGPRKGPEKAQKSTQKTLSLILKNKYITRAEIAKLTGLSDSGVKKQLKRLQLKKVLRRVGSDRDGHWEVLKSLL